MGNFFFAMSQGQKISKIPTPRGKNHINSLNSIGTKRRKYRKSSPPKFSIIKNTKYPINSSGTKTQKTHKAKNQNYPKSLGKNCTRQLVLAHAMLIVEVSSPTYFLTNLIFAKIFILLLKKPFFLF